MIRLLLHWILSAIALILVAKFVPGFSVDSFWHALWAVVVIGLLNATIGLLLKIITLPINILTFGLLTLVINAVVLLIAAHLVKGLSIASFVPAFWGALALAILQMIFRLLEPKSVS